jgi:dipeptidyl aminopeptidase/acylaminoacyl peptidase
VRRGPDAFEWRTIATDGSDPRSFMGLLTSDVSTIAWSPDGRRIAFNKGSLAGLWVANADGSDERQLTTTGYDYYARWSPDGARIAFQTEPLFGSPSRRIGVVDATGANRRVLTEGLIDERPIWSPDSRRIAFEKQILVNGEQVCTLREVDVTGGIVVDILPRRPVRACPNAAWRRIAPTG